MPDRSDKYTDLIPHHRRKTKVMVRFPNEDFYQEIEINMDEFKPSNDFDDEVFGWYHDTYISIKK